MLKRSFRQPFTNRVATITLWSIVSALFAGPFFYWKRGALIEGAIMATVGAMYIFVDDSSLTISPELFDNIEWVIWGAFVVLAPFLLAMSYKRRGWIETTDGGPASP